MNFNIQKEIERATAEYFLADAEILADEQKRQRIENERADGYESLQRFVDRHGEAEEFKNIAANIAAFLEMMGEQHAR